MWRVFTWTKILKYPNPRDPRNFLRSPIVKSRYKGIQNFILQGVYRANKQKTRDIDDSKFMSNHAHLAIHDQEAERQQTVTQKETKKKSIKEIK